MNRPTILVYKPIGVTPLSLIHYLKQHDQTLINKTISYAGRLDPMAEGLLLLLVGEENKKRKEYEVLPKTYVVDILLGIATDTYDLLGLITKTHLPDSGDEEATKQALSSFRGTYMMEYPPFSSKPVNGKPLYYWAREGKLATLTLPKKQVTIASLTLKQRKTLSGEEVATYAYNTISRVTGNFRQETILEQWKRFGTTYKATHFPLLQVEITCSSGTYMRAIAHTLGQSIGIPSLAFAINRTRIGSFTLEDAVKLDDLTLVQ